MENEITLEELYNDLEKYKDFDADSKNCEKFLETVDKIVLKGDCASIPILFGYFDDNSDYSWVMEELMLSLENYKTKELLGEVCRDPDYYWNKSNLRFEGLIYGIVNSPKDLQELRQFIRGMEYSSPFIIDVFMVLNSSKLPRHAELLKELSQELKR